MPARAHAGEIIKFQCIVRNDGWNSWRPATHRLRVIWEKGDPIICGVASQTDAGQFARFTMSLKLPEKAGRYKLEMHMCDGEKPFQRLPDARVEIVEK
jgi:hypothetical protein